MKIGILGSGRMGGTLGTLFARSGHEVTFSYSRTRTKLQHLADQVGMNGRFGNPDDAARDADLILLAVHWSQVDHVLGQTNLEGKTIITCCNPLNLDSTELVVGHTTSGAEVLAQKLPQSRVIAAFQATPSELLLPVYEARRSPLPHPSLIFCGDDVEGKLTVASLIKELGFSPVDAGALQIARLIEPFGVLSGMLAYDTDQGPDWAYRLGKYDELFGD